MGREETFVRIGCKKGSRIRVPKKETGRCPYVNEGQTFTVSDHVDCMSISFARGERRKCDDPIRPVSFTVKGFRFDENCYGTCSAFKRSEIAYDEYWAYANPGNFDEVDCGYCLLSTQTPAG